MKWLGMLLSKLPSTQPVIRMQHAETLPPVTIDTLNWLASESSRVSPCKLDMEELDTVLSKPRPRSGSNLEH